MIRRVPGQIHPVDAHVGSRIRLGRTLLGMSQEELGAAVCLTFQQVQKYEKGTNGTRSSRLYDLARALDVPVAWFFEDYPGDAIATQAGPVEPDRATLELIRGYQDLPSDEVRTSIRRQIAHINAAWNS